MKYAFLICDGASDWAIPELNNRTIFETANTPAMDFLANRGRMGLLKTIPDSMKPGSEVANMSIMGYNPEKDLTGRGALEALSSEVEMKKNDIAFRLNLITLEGGNIKDHSAGHITSEESRPIILTLQKKLGGPGVDIFPGIQYRHILRLDGDQYSEKVICTPPHDKLDQPYKDWLVQAQDELDEKAKKTAIFLNELIERSHGILKAESSSATHVWPWSGGKKPTIESFKAKYGLTGGVISAVDLIFGIGIAAGLTPVHVEGATGLPNTNFIGKSRAGLDVLRKFDYLFLHVEAADEMGHAGVVGRKIKAVEDFDHKIVQPFIDAMDEFKNKLTIVVLPDHPTPCALRTHTSDPVPFVVYHPLMKKNEKHRDRKFNEKSGIGGELGLINDGESFVRTILKMGGK